MFPSFDSYTVSFVRPGYLGLLVALPVLWFFSFRALAGLGGLRRWSALILRTLVLLFFVLAMAEIQIVKNSDRLTVIYLLDQSLSIPQEDRRAMVEYANQAITRHRDRDDRVGVIAFGRNAGIEIPPFDEDVKIVTPLETEPLIDQRYTDLSAAIKMAMGSFPEDAAKRLVIISDGNQNRGEVLEQAKAASDAGVGIDVVPVYYKYQGEIRVERLAIPPEIRKGQPVDLRVTVHNAGARNVPGRLVIRQTSNGQTTTLAERKDVVLEPGPNFFTVREKIEEPSFYTFDAEFIPENRADDKMAENNRATAYADVAGAARILLIEDEHNRGQHDRLVEALRAENLEVIVRNTSQLFTDKAELQQYDCVILANVPASWAKGDAAEAFSKEQIEMLVANTEVLGAGLIMLGGPNSFGAGAWAGTELEKAMPVDFHIKNAKVVPKGALALIMHASEMANGNYWQKVVAKSALQALSGQDYCGMLHWNGNDTWMWGQASGGMWTVGPNRPKMLSLIDKMAPGDMPQFDPAMQMAYKSLSRLSDAAVKHMIIISDGDPSPPAAATLAAFANSKITVTTVAIGTHGPVEQGVMKNIANKTGGKWYEAKNPQALPKIYQQETRRVTRPLVHENAAGFTPQIKYQNELIAGIDSFPPITGYVMTTVKESPLVEVALVSPEPGGADGDPKYNTILASWQYGLGRTVAFTTDAGATWANRWTGWPNYDKFFTQVVRYAMRPTGQTGKFSIATETKDGKTRVIVTALDENDEFKNFQQMDAAVLAPDMKSIPVRLEQTGPGRYEALFPSEDAGSYFVMVRPGNDPEGKPYRPLRTGINVAYSAEFREEQANRALLVTLANNPPVGGEPGKVIESQQGSLDELLAINSFRHDLPKATSSQDIWQWLIILASILFFIDVFNRRVTVHLDWLWPILDNVWRKLRGRELAPARTEYMERLRSKKAEATQQIETQRAAVRFEPRGDDPTAFQDAVKDASGPATSGPSEQRPTTPTGGGLDVGKKDEESYTDRLLKAKKKVWDERKDQK